MNTDKVEKRLFVKIRFSASGQRALAETAYFKDDMAMDFYLRWEWYFKYRSALLQVKSPKAFVELIHGSYDFVLPETEYKQKLENLIRAAKAKITKCDNDIQLARDNWNEIFPIDLHPDWKRALQKRLDYSLRLVLLTTEYESINTYKL